MEFIHRTVLLEETIKFLNIKKNGTYFDLTVGGGGLTQRIIDEVNEDSFIVAVDIDPEAIEFCEKKFKNLKNVKLIKENFKNIKEISKKFNKYKKIDGIIIDSGISSHQIDNAHRGFSYRYDSKLDMRMSMEGTSAYDIINNMSENDIVFVIKKYGEERFAKKIASKIINFRKKYKKIFTTYELVSIIESAVPFKYKLNEVLSRVFQAFRIYVNDEIENIGVAIKDSIDSLSNGGRLLIITFHSLEDRLVKKSFFNEANPCVCQIDLPVCLCNLKPRVSLITKKPIIASEKEVLLNNRCRSAKLRVCQKL